MENAVTNNMLMDFMVIAVTYLKSEVRYFPGRPERNNYCPLVCWAIALLFSLSSLLESLLPCVVVHLVTDGQSLVVLVCPFNDFLYLSVEQRFYVLGSPY